MADIKSSADGVMMTVFYVSQIIDHAVVVLLRKPLGDFITIAAVVVNLFW